MKKTELRKHILVCDWSETTPQYIPPNPEAKGPFSKSVSQISLTPPALSLLGMLTEKFGLPEDVKPTTFGEAYETLQKLGKGLFWALSYFFEN
ncbi:MAG: hypothetical protein WAT71_06675 [Ignavibacteria bacterium]